MYIRDPSKKKICISELTVKAPLLIETLLEDSLKIFTSKCLIVLKKRVSS